MEHLLQRSRNLLGWRVKEDSCYKVRSHSSKGEEGAYSVESDVMPDNEEGCRGLQGTD